ncbi:MAG: hypothetical protein GDA54_00410 [Alphaproteobacteria bacterium GM7ARS4]|nr:hypothetical protein [Alphaproteobacteria bacterium GM7ARS4]
MPVPPSYGKITGYERDIRVQSDNGNLAFQPSKRTTKGTFVALRRFFGRKISFVTHGLTKKGRKPTLPPRSQSAISPKKLLSPHDSRVAISHQLTHHFRRAIDQHRRAIEQWSDDTKNLKKHAAKALPKGISKDQLDQWHDTTETLRREVLKENSTKTFDQHAQKLNDALDDTIKSHLLQINPDTGDVSRKSLKGRQMYDVYQQFTHSLAILDSVAQNIQKSLNIPSRQLPKPPQDYVSPRSLKDGGYEDRSSWVDDNKDYVPLNPATRNRKAQTTDYEPLTPRILDQQATSQGNASATTERKSDKS